jgi:hypothetical protein
VNTASCFVVLRGPSRKPSSKEMRTMSVLAIAVGVSIAACGKPDSGGSPAPTTNAAGTTPTAAAVTGTPAGAPAKGAFVQKGIKPGNVIVGYIQDPADPSGCVVATDVPAKKDQFTKDGDKIAAMVKGKVVPSCPTDNVVGTCSLGFGMLGNYFGPKWTAESAKKDCLKQSGQKWVE